MSDDERQALVSEGMLTVQDAQQLCGLSRSELYSLMERGEVPYAKIGRRRLIPRRAILDLLARHVVARPPRS